MHCRILLTVIVSITLGLMPLASYGQDTTIVEVLDKAVVVSAGKPSSTREGSPVQARDKKEMERLGVQSLHEVVRTFSGVNLKDYGGVGGVKTVSIRSMGAQHTAVCYDGITMSNTQTGYVDIGQFSLDNVDLVSLTIGQSDEIFQTARSFASSGVLNINTVVPHFDGQPFHIVAQMKLASFGTYNPYLMYQQKISDRWSAAVNGDWMISNGDYPYKIRNGKTWEEDIRENGDVNTIRGEANIYGDMGRGGKLSVKANYLNSERGLPGSVVLYSQGGNERLWDENFFASAKYENSFSDKWAMKGNVKYSYAWSHYLAYDDIYMDGKEEDYYTQNEYYASAALQYRPTSRLRLTLAEDFFINTLDATIPECAYPTRFSTMTSLAGQYKDSRLTVTASLLGTYITEDVKIGVAADDKWRISPSASISYKLFEERNFRIRASYKDGFRVPTFNDLYYSRVGNHNLAPEKSTQFNLGFTWSGHLWENVVDYASFTIDGYYNVVKDKIVAIPTMFIWRMLNMGRVVMSGADFNAYANFGLSGAGSLILSLNYSYQYAVDVSDPESKSYKHQIPYTPEHSGTVSLSWKNRWVNMGYLCSMVGKRYSFPQNIEMNLIEGYMDHSISLSREFNISDHKITLLAEVQNIGDVNYEVVKNYPMPGRSYRLTLKYNF